ncbi:macrolide-specific efflux system membrane fusion protein [Rhodobium orientis]|uniref:Efflux transporter periplasmic adaptor subunit n=1 Tax=Rhodobium orientis TaxID=34017 RepID=A0A327JJT3_9HYPH|nr:efflux RND transporter periplasmic adaptor subunit [Rhodobium orientis]MBB4305245.1 macrolide-specific efflux system membrane fusion protein [Rhodobium orientis]MBK5952127.1 efflux transporter periplasmic adaptor subunit [Rhodobium orientis]RAI26321.1 efflux transporter periplasmic adaptor subunit [Rhodobium orientis]
MSAPARKRSLGRRIGVALVVLAVIAAAAWFARPYLVEEEAPDVMTAPVRRGDVEVTVLASGTLRPAKLVAVGAQVSGRITALHVALGDTVTEGDLIAEIDSVTQENALRTAEATLANVRAQKVEKEATLTLNRQSLERQRRMLAQQATSQADFESAEAAVKTTEAQIDALAAQVVEAEVAVETARANLGYTRITAPMGGTVLAIVNQEGQTVNAAQSAPTIVVLGQLDSMKVEAEISEADIVNVKPGQPVYFTIVGDLDTRYDAVLESIEPAPDSIVNDPAISSSSSSTSSSSTEAIYYNGIFHVPNPDGHLRTYMTAEVHIVLGAARDVLTIPAVAIGPRDADGSRTVDVLETDGEVATRKVEIGLNDKSVAEVRSGLEEGARVVTGTRSGETATRERRPRRGPMGF